MRKNTVIELTGRDEGEDSLTDVLQAGAQQLIQQAVEGELQEFWPCMPKAEHGPTMQLGKLKDRWQ